MKPTFQQACTQHLRLENKNFLTYEEEDDLAIFYLPI